MKVEETPSLSMLILPPPVVWLSLVVVGLVKRKEEESMKVEETPSSSMKVTLYLTRKGFYEFWNWFDSESWYPLGRIISGTLYPGLMVTAAIIYWDLKFLRFAVHIREVCVLTAPFFASNTTLVAYFFGMDLWDSGAGLVVAALIAICPIYISRLVVGSYDNEGVAIFALLLTFYLFVKLSILDHLPGLLHRLLATFIWSLLGGGSGGWLLGWKVEVHVLEVERGGCGL